MSKIHMASGDKGRSDGRVNRGEPVATVGDLALSRPSRREFLVALGVAIGVVDSAPADAPRHNSGFQRLTANEVDTWLAGFVAGEGKICLVGTRSEIETVVLRDQALRATPEAVGKLLDGVELSFRLGYLTKSEGPGIIQPANYYTPYSHLKNPTNLRQSGSLLMRDDRFVSPELKCSGTGCGGYYFDIAGSPLKLAIEFDYRFGSDRNWFLSLFRYVPSNLFGDAPSSESTREVTRSAVKWTERLGFGERDVLLSRRTYHWLPARGAEADYDMQIGVAAAPYLLEKLRTV